MDVPTDRISIGIVVATGLIGLIGYLFAFRTPFDAGDGEAIVLPAAAIAVAVGLAVLTWFSLVRAG